MERGARLSGSMFPLYRGDGARLLRALTSLALDRHADAYEEIRPPTLVLTETMTSTGHLPKFSDEAYHVERDDLWAIPTAEVPLTSLRRGEILAEAELPAALTRGHPVLPPGGRGRRPRHAGLLRVHEFEKVELFAYATAEQAPGVTGRHPGPGRGPAPGARALLPGPRPVHRRPRGVLGPHLRPRGLRAGVRPVAGGLLGQLVPRLPGPAGQRPLPPRWRWPARPGPHGQRLGPGLGPDLGRPGRERPAARRLGAPARLPGPLVRRRAGSRPRLSVRPRARRRSGSPTPRMVVISDGLGGVDLDARPQPLDVDVERLGVADVVGAPDPVDQDVAGQNPAGVLDQELEQLELLAPQLDLLAPDEDPTLVEVDPDVTGLPRPLVVTAGGATGRCDARRPPIGA